MHLESLGWESHFEQQFREWSAAGLLPGRVGREDRGSYVVHGERDIWRAGVTGAYRHQAVDREDYPAVGDWVAVEPCPGGDEARIHGLVPRRSAIKRKAAGEAVDVQVIAANVDVLLVCCGLDRDFNIRRIERYLTLAYHSNVSPTVALTKADLEVNPGTKLAEVERVALGVPVHLVSTVTGEGMEQVRAAIRPGMTAALVGSSGVGKSSLVNYLLNEQAMKAGSVRADDGRGRHTTTHRQLLPVPGGGVIIDTPGMRELQLWGDESGASATFADIEELGAGCRFRDCAHQNEPGCRVLAAVLAGELDRGRLASFRKLQAEIRWLAAQDDPLVRAEERSRWKTIHKAARKHMKRKYGE